MGLDVNRCVDGCIDDQYLCGICCGIIVVPKVILTCSHVFCEQCIREWIESKHNCPIDREPTLDVECLGDVSDEYYDNYSDIVLKCVNWGHGCDQTFTIIDIKSHEDMCRYQPNGVQKSECYECGHFVPVTDENHNCIELLKSEIQELKTSQTKLQQINRELKRKLRHSVNECQELGKRLDTCMSAPKVMPKYSLELQDLVEVLQDLEIIYTPEVIQTLLAVDRELFCPQNPYNNYKTDIGFGAEFNSPVIDTMLMELLYEHLVAEDREAPVRVLDIGCGTGYLSVCFALICVRASKPCTIIAIDHIPELIESAQNVVNNNYMDLLGDCCPQFVVHDGRDGYCMEGPYDVINVGASVDEYPDEELINQLKCGGRMTVPVADDTGSQDLMTIDKLADGQTVCESHLKVAIKPLISREMQLNADFNWIWINSKQLFS